jgi:hypothetical protein
MSKIQNSFKYCLAIIRSCSEFVILLLIFVYFVVLAKSIIDDRLAQGKTKVP